MANSHINNTKRYDMIFSLDEFKAKMSAHAPARATHYAIKFFPPSGVDNGTLQDVTYFVDTANSPSIQFSADEVKFKGYGMTEMRPAQASHEPLTVTIIGDQRGLFKDLFERWFKLVFNFDQEETMHGIPLETYNYPSEYWGTIELYLYDVESKLYTTYKMHKAFPLNMGAVSLGYSDTDSLLRLSLTFEYRNYSKTVGETLQQSINPNKATLSTKEFENIEILNDRLKNPSQADYENRNYNDV